MRTAARRRCAGWLLPALLLAGCQATGGRPVPPFAAPVPAPIQRASAASAPAPDGPHAVPLCLDTVFRLAQNQNGQVKLARARLEEAFANQAIAARWLPDLTVGAGYYRHEGGIQDFQGNLVHSSYGSVLAGLELRGKLDPRDVVFQRVEAERKVWQQKGELSRLTSENLLDAAGTYVDLLAAQSSLVIAEEAEGRLREALQQAARLAKIDPGVRVEVTRIEAEQAAQQGLTRKLRGAARGAEAKLAYLLGLPPTAQIAPADRRLVPLPLVDAGRPAEQLIEQALTAGPGVREVEGLLAVIDAARAQAEGPGKWLPAVEVNVVEAGFGAGPGSRLDWDNRLDLGVHLRWNLTEALTARERLRAADARVQQAHLGYDDLRAKLALGVREAREAALSGAEQLTFAEQRVRHAEEAARLSERRWQQNIKGRSPSEVLLAVRALAGARLELVQTVRDLDKAQLRLLVLTGGLGRK